MARVILYTGKGGVGKTSIAAATGLRCADRGLRTVVVSTDPAHSLSDSLDREVGPEPKLLSSNFWVQEIDVLHQMQKHWREVQEYLATLLSWRGVNDLIAEEVAVIPGMDELASLLQIVYLQSSGDFDVVVVDMAPTAETLRFLAFPEAANWYLQRIFPLQRQAMRLARPLLRGITDMPLPDDHVFDAVRELVQDLDRMHALLADPDVSSVRVVLNLEKMVIREAQRTLTYVSLYGFPVDGVVCNRVMPEAVTDPYFDKWKRAQAENLELVQEAFSPLPLFSVPMFDQEVVGFDMLRRVADAAFEEQDPSLVLHRGRLYEVRKADGIYQLLLGLPLADKEDIDLVRKRDELIVRVGNHKHNLLLPDTLARLSVTGAKYEGDDLVISFAAEPDRER